MPAQPLKVLLADDSPSDRMILRALLIRRGFEVVTASDGQEALERFERFAPDIVLLDSLMPRKDGFEVARELKQRGQERDDFVPIIFLTALSDPDSLARCIEAGGDDFLPKPYNAVTISAKISAMNRMRDMHSTVRLQRDQIAENNKHLLHEQQVAKSVFDRVAHNGCLDAPNIQFLLSPLSVFNGDVLLACMKPAGGMHVLIGDFTGHGLPAAIGAMPLAEIFYGMTRKGFGMVDVLREINRKLKVILPVGFFCCAAMVDLSVQDRSAEIWMGGLPDILLYRPSGTEPLKSNHLPLGILSAESFKADTYRIDMQLGDRLYMWSDGIVEAENPQGEMFGDERLKGLFKGVFQPQGLFSTIQEQVQQFIGGQQASDDLTLLELTMVPPDHLSVEAVKGGGSNLLGPRNWSFRYELRGDSLVAFNPVPLVMSLTLEVPELRSRSGDIFTILTELYSNALEHGLLGLDSALKGSVEGFAEYYRLRDERLLSLGDESLSFDITHSATAEGGVLLIDVSDSGDGFDVGAVESKRHQDAKAPDAYCGRGIPLLQQLCRRVVFLEEGRRVVAEYHWRLPEEGQSV